MPGGLIHIREGSIREAVAVSRQIPELTDPPGEEIYQARLSGVRHLILVAEVDGVVAGFKAGYERDGVFYSWMGGVKPAFRFSGLAKKLAMRQEEWAREHHYNSIVFKTRNHHKGMLIFALKNGFDIIGFQEKPFVSDHRVMLRKVL